MILKYFRIASLVCLVVSIFGCATHISKPSAAVEPTKVRLANYQQVYMKDVGISEQFAGSSANQKALKKIDERMYANMKMVFPSLQRLRDQETDNKSTKKTLIIEPYIKEIKFIGGGARFMAGAMAGSSAVLMQAKFTDADDHDVIANPEFYRVANAFSGAWSIGATDNRMLEEIANDVVSYASNNK